MARGELTIDLDVHYADDEKLALLVEWPDEAQAARDLYVQMICYCKIKMSDGFVPSAMLSKLAWPGSLPAARRQAELLCRVGSIVEVLGGWNLPGYLKRNKSREQITGEETASEAGSRGNHERWHVRRGVVDTSCNYCWGLDESGDDRPDHRPDVGGDVAPDRGANRDIDVDVDNDSGPDRPDQQRAERPRDELWDALVEECGIDPSSITKSMRGSLNGAAKQLRDVGATAPDVHARAERYRRKWPTVSLTPSALAKHWATLAADEAPSSPARDPVVEARIARRRSPLASAL